MKDVTKVTVGIFDKLNSLFAFLDDRLICIRNIKSCRKAHLLFADIQEKKQTIRFLSANNFNVKEESNSKLKVEFLDSKNYSNKTCAFFINTKYKEYEISNAINNLSIDINSNTSDIYQYLLNSNSFFGYYKQYEGDKNTNVIGSPSKPMKMDNYKGIPF